MAGIGVLFERTCIYRGAVVCLEGCGCRYEIYDTTLHFLDHAVPFPLLLCRDTFSSVVIPPLRTYDGRCMRRSQELLEHKLTLWPWLRIVKEAIVQETLYSVPNQAPTYLTLFLSRMSHRKRQQGN